MTRIIYIDGIWDLFHSGHILHFKKVKELDNQENILLVGIISDEDAKSYKSSPIYNQDNRKLLIESCKYVDKVIENAPLVITESFMKENNIDLVCHAFSNENDFLKQKELFDGPIKLNKFQIIPYNTGISTTDIINKIKNNY